MRTLRLATTILPVIALVAFGATSPAHAGENCTDSSDLGGATVTFKHYGEHLIIKDNSADGYSAVAHLEKDDRPGDHYWYWNTKGNGTTEDVNLPNITDGIGVHVGAFLGNWEGEPDQGIYYGSNSVISYCTGIAY
ncbi:hypothetical protein QFZ24_010049 [Streptomyces phaeochromogenes]|jgi:hypothetical protein|uniref:hypothetical protein n=1 Tax=Streptomyces phaeochromogenes TaxID=1923 RepID=UPI0027935266|nr:hypothetical protein [Streptomyces phaeochromogenes]MDQ0956040.1 hypothetical protein [Streptomyces phaeochromogenes]